MLDSTGLNLQNLDFKQPALDAFQSNAVKPQSNSGASPTNSEHKVSEIKEQNNYSQNEGKEQVEESKKDFKEVINSKVKSQELDEDETTNEVQASVQNQIKSKEEVDNDEIELTIREVISKIVEAIDADELAEIEIDLSALDIDTESLELAIELISEELGEIVEEIIDSVAQVEASDINTLYEKSELIDTLQNIQEQLEAFAATDTQTQAGTALDTEAEIDTDTGWDIQELDSSQEIKEIKIEVQEQDTNKQNLQQIDVNKEQVQQNTNQTHDTKQEIKVDTKQETTTKDLSSKLEDYLKKISDRPKLEAQEQTNKLSELKKEIIKDAKLEFTKESTLKEQTISKADLDSKTQQTLIQATRILKDVVKAKTQAQVEQTTTKGQEQVQTQETEMDESQLDWSGDEAMAQSNQQVSKSNLSPVAKEVKIIQAKEALQILPDKIEKLPNNSKQEIKLYLHPRELGSVDITITKENNQVTIKILADNDSALKSLRQDLNNLTNTLKEKGVDIKDIELTRSSGADLEQKQDGEKFNEAREEQKKKFTETAPAWLTEENSSNFKGTFSSALRGMFGGYR